MNAHPLAQRLPNPALHPFFKNADFLSALDKALALFLHHKTPTDHDAHRVAHIWLAALTSYQWSRGHACLDFNQLAQRPGDTLGLSNEEVQTLTAHLHLPDLAQYASTLPWTQGEHSPLVYQQDQLYLRRAWQAEQTIRHSLQARLDFKLEMDASLQTQLDTLFTQRPREEDRQRLACETAASHRVALITGGPGTGKTTTVVRLLALLLSQSATPLRISLAAPTGKAAARLSESIQKAISHMPAQVQALIPTQAQTLHRLLQQAKPQLASDVVIVDEASMVDLEMMARLMQAVPLTSRLILLGDKDQLASVEAGAVMSQLSNGPLLRAQTVTLLQSHRFDPNSGIGQWAKTINADDNTAALQQLWAQTPLGFLHPDQRVTRMGDTLTTHSTHWAQDLRTGWQHWLKLLQPHREGQRCDDAQAKALLHHFSDFCVLCALREGPAGVAVMNREIERALGWTLPPNAWYVGRPIMVTRNDYGLGVMNGDIGICLPHANGSLQVAFEHEGGVRWVSTARLAQIDTVFAMTVHKSQGSEFKHVLLVLPAQDAPILTRELIYTGLTRAKDRLTLWASNPQILFKASARKVLRSGGLAV